MVDVSKDLAMVHQARRTETSTSFELRPKASPCDTQLSEDNCEPSQTPNAVDRPFKIDELRKLRSEVDSTNVNKS